MADRTQIQQIKDALDISEIASQYLKLKRSGNNYFALCPFHNEKTPSFSINPELGIFKCFGCGESGDVITFIEKMERVEFPEALEIAAQKAGIKLERKFQPEDRQEIEKKKKIIGLNFLVAKFYNFILTKHKKGTPGLKYAKKRNFKDKTINEFLIGYAPNSYETLKKFLLKKGYKSDELVRWGLLIRKNNKTYDKFRNRLMFPIYNTRGETVGFSGRLISDGDLGPKYLNSPETLVFKKNELLFGLNQTKDDIRKKGFAILSEGQIDVISAYQANFKNFVAPLGTSITENQLKTLKRYTDTIHLCFDSDEAGERALVRAAKIAYIIGFNVKGIDLESYQDIDEFLNKSKEKFQKRIDSAVSIIEHLIVRLERRLNLTSIEGKTQALTILSQVLTSINDEVTQESLITETAKSLGVQEEVVKRKIAENKGYSVTQGDERTHKDKIKIDKISKEIYLLSIFIQNPTIAKQYLSEIKLMYFQTEAAQKVYEILKNYLKKAKKPSLKKLRRKIPAKLLPLFKNLSLVKIESKTKDELKEEIEEILKHLNETQVKNTIRKLRINLKDAEREKDTTKQNKILKQLKKITNAQKET